MVCIESYIFLSTQWKAGELNLNTFEVSSRLKHKQCSQLDTPLMEMIIVSEEDLAKVTVCRVVLGPPKLLSVRKSFDCIQLRREFLQGFS